MPEAAIETPVAAPAVETPVVANAEATVATGSTLLSSATEDGNTVEAATPAETPEAKIARETVEAENKSLLEAKDEDLTPEQLAKKAELVKSQDTKANTVPEKYEVKVEGFEIDAPMMDALSPVFKKHGLTQAAVQELATAYAPIVQAQVEKQQTQAIEYFNGIKDGWKNDTIKALGADAPKEMAFAAKFLNKFGTPELRAVMDETGVGNHPELVKAFIKAGKSISADSFVDPSKQSTGPQGLESIYTHPTSKATLK